MAKTISKEKREDIIKHIKAGERKENIVKWLFICKRTVNRVWAKFEATGRYEAEPHRGGRKSKISEEMMEKVVEKVKEQPDITLLELIEEFQLKVCQSALCRRLIKRGFRYKKRHYIQVAGNGRM